MQGLTLADAVLDTVSVHPGVAHAERRLILKVAPRPQRSDSPTDFLNTSNMKLNFVCLCVFPLLLALLYSNESAALDAVEGLALAGAVLHAVRVHPGAAQAEQRLVLKVAPQLQRGDIEAGFL